MKLKNWLLILFMLGSACSSKYTIHNESQKQEVIRIDRTMTESDIERKVNNAKNVDATINYHFKAALEGKKPVLKCSHRIEDFKLYLLDGSYCLAEKKYEFAKRNFEEALKECESMAKGARGVLLYYLGISYEGIGNLDEAIECYKKSIEYNKEIQFLEGINEAKERLNDLEIKP